MVSDDSLKAAIHATVAKQIIEGLDSEHRDKLLTDAMTKALTDYDFRNAVSKTVAAKAMEVAQELVESPEWRGRIAVAIQAGFDSYLTNLRAASEAMCKELMHGKRGDSSYSIRSGEILQAWPSK